MNTKIKPTIVITLGDPAGIGKEITFKALKDKSIKNSARYILIGDDTDIKKGTIQARAGKIAYANILQAVNILKEHKGPKALVTAPINKASFKKAGIKYSGHTEILKVLTSSKNTVMSFWADDFRVALVTRHIPISKVSKSITKKEIVNTTLVFNEYVKKSVNKRKPVIAIAALNPHAGDDGVIGTEDKTIVLPAVKALLKKGVNVIGPIAADVLFYKLKQGLYDGVVCMYHDQALVPFKMLYFDKGVNASLGLPFIRTSPDHGTAFDIAGKAKADPTSMIEAIKMAIRF